MRIIQTTSSLSPEFGGTARCVPALSVELARLGNRVTVLSLDFPGFSGTDNLPTHPDLDYVSLPVKLKLGLRPIWIPGYRSRLLELLAGARDLLIHDNGIWLPYSGLIARLASQLDIPLLTTIHGMLEPWALSYGRLRKMAAWNLYQRRRLEANELLQATSREEAAHLQALGLRNSVAVLPNGTPLPALENIPDLADTGKRILLFLSRIHPKKGLLDLVKAVGILKPADWIVVVAGYDEGGTWGKIQREIQAAGLEDYFKYIGPVSDREKWSWYKAAEAFILPSYSENFGLVIAEALASGTPVITTTETPWEDLERYDCGWWIAPRVPDLVDTLRVVLALDREPLAEMGRKGRQLIEEKYSWPAVAARQQAIYHWLLQGGAAPPEIITGDN